MSRGFKDRADAGRQLAAAVRRAQPGPDALVLALPRGGVPVAAEIALELNLPLDVVCVRKLGVPFQPELAMGAVASGDAVIRNEEVIEHTHVAPAEFERVLAAEREELARRERSYRGEAPLLPVTGRTVVLVDDGLATGATMAAAVSALRMREAGRIVVAVPVGAPDACERLAGLADEVICLLRPMFFTSVGGWYEDFDQTDDAEVKQLLAGAARRQAPG
jgi:putative phosphoribosyl transferase